MSISKCQTRFRCRMRTAIENAHIHAKVERRSSTMKEKNMNACETKSFFSDGNAQHQGMAALTDGRTTSSATKGSSEYLYSRHNKFYVFADNSLSTVVGFQSWERLSSNLISIIILWSIVDCKFQLFFAQNFDYFNIASMETRLRIFI